MGCRCLWAIDSINVLCFWFAYGFCWASITRILYGSTNLFPIFAIGWAESRAPISGIISPQFLGQGFTEGWLLASRIVSFLNNTCWWKGTAIIIFSWGWAFFFMRLAECWAVRRWWATFAIVVFRAWGASSLFLAVIWVCSSWALMVIWRAFNWATV